MAQPFVTGSASDEFGGGRVTCQHGDVAFAFVSGNTALDLAGTRKWRNNESPEELLCGPADLQLWFDAVPEFPRGLVVSPDDFALAMTLREAIYQLATDRLRGGLFGPANLQVVNEIAATPGFDVRLLPAGLEREGTARHALADIARAAISMLADPNASLKECGRTTCTRIYLDRSRGSRRTWCGMDECGNRVKAAAYRARKRDAARSATGARQDSSDT